MRQITVCETSSQPYSVSRMPSSGMKHLKVLIIQGVAGSGKTSIALHRAAFLLYPVSSDHRIGEYHDPIPQPGVLRLHRKRSAGAG